MLIKVTNLAFEVLRKKLITTNLQQYQNLFKDLEYKTVERNDADLPWLCARKTNKKQKTNDAMVLCSSTGVTVSANVKSEF